MLVVYRPSYAITELSASLRMSFTFLILGLFAVDVIQTAFASPEPKKLTNEEVLKELGVEIKMKGRISILAVREIALISVFDPTYKAYFVSFITFRYILFLK